MSVYTGAKLYNPYIGLYEIKEGEYGGYALKQQDLTSYALRETGLGNKINQNQNKLKALKEPDLTIDKANLRMMEIAEEAGNEYQKALGIAITKGLTNKESEKYAHDAMVRKKNMLMDELSGIFPKEILGMAWEKIKK